MTHYTSERRRVRIAVVGGGISGIAAADACQAFADVTLFEARPSLGGHTETHSVLVDSGSYAVDSGFTLFNRSDYPLFSQWLERIGVSTLPTEMSLSVRTASGLEYGTAHLAALFCQRRNALRPTFLKMLHDIRRFYSGAGAVVEDDPRTLAEYLENERYSRAFADHYLLPICAAMWSVSREGARDMPVALFAAVFANHDMMPWRGPRQWRVIRGGSSSYVRAFTRSFQGQLRLACPVRSVRRDCTGVTVVTDAGSEPFDYLVLACHSDQALALVDATAEERGILGAFRYQPNRAVLHSDASVMPRNEEAWSSWNVYAGAQGRFECTYWLNRLQRLGAAARFFVTLNPARPLKSVWFEREYRHPVFSVGAKTAQLQADRISGHRRTFYCGAWCGRGLHEDGFRSGIEAARRLAKLLDP